MDYVGLDEAALRLQWGDLVASKEEMSHAVQFLNRLPNSFSCLVADVRAESVGLSTRIHEETV